MLLRHRHANQLVADHGDDGGLSRLRRGDHLGHRENRVGLVGVATLIPDGDRLVEVVVVKFAQSPWRHAGQGYRPGLGPTSPGWVVPLGNKSSHPKVESI